MTRAMAGVHDGRGERSPGKAVAVAASNGSTRGAMPVTMPWCGSSRRNAETDKLPLVGGFSAGSCGYVHAKEHQSCPEEERRGETVSERQHR